MSIKENIDEKHLFLNLIPMRLDVFCKMCQDDPCVFDTTEKCERDGDLITLTYSEYKRKESELSGELIFLPPETIHSLEHQDNEPEQEERDETIPIVRVDEFSPDGGQGEAEFIDKTMLRIVASRFFTIPDGMPYCIQTGVALYYPNDVIPIATIEKHDALSQVMLIGCDIPQGGFNTITCVMFNYSGNVAYVKEGMPLIRIRYVKSQDVQYESLFV